MKASKQLCFDNGHISIHRSAGGLPIERRKPKNHDEPYHILVPFKFKWRATLGKVTCDCTVVREAYQPWYGFTWYHSDGCAILAHLKRWPQMENFFYEYDPRVIGRSE